MAIKNRKTANDMIPARPVEVCLYGPPNSGKTTIAATLGKSLYLDFEGSLSRSDLVSNVADRVDVESWSDVSELDQSDLKGVNAVVVDTMSAMFRQIAAGLPRGGKVKMFQSDGSLTQKAYGAMLTAFTAWRDRIKSWGCDVILIAHAEEKATATEEMRIRPALTAGAMKAVTQDSDLIAFCEIRGKDRVMCCAPDVWFGKGPQEWGVLQVPDLRGDPSWFADKLDELREIIRSRQAKAIEAQKAMAPIREEIDADWGDDALAVIALANDLLERIEALNESLRPPLRQQLWNKAKDMGLTYDRQEKTFLAREDANE